MQGFDFIWKFIQEHYPAISLNIAIALAVTLIVMRLSRSYYHWSGRIKKTEDDCGKIEGHIVPQLKNLNTSVNLINTSLNSLIVFLKTKHGEMDASLFKSFSPVQLTDLGTIVLNEIGGKEFIDKNEDTLIKEMDMQGIKTALDAQNFAPIVIGKISSLDSFNKIKDFAFKNPILRTKNEKKEDVAIPLDMNTITNIMGIYLRNKYLDRHPELNPDDIPTKVN